MLYINSIHYGELSNKTAILSNKPIPKPYTIVHFGVVDSHLH